MKLTPVKSSNINAIGHDKAASELYVEFKNGKTFIYKDVSQTDALKLFQAESVGKHFNQFIKAVKVGAEVTSDKPEMTDAEKIETLRYVLQQIADIPEVRMDECGSMARQALEATKD